MEKRGLIFLVEDNPDDEEFARLAFKDAMNGHDFEVARDGAEALELLIEKGRRPNLILLDLNLPKIGGLDVLSRLRENEGTKFLPVVVLSSSTHEKDLKEAYKRGANGYVKKPLDFSEFVEAAKDLGRYWLERNQPPPLI